MKIRRRGRRGSTRGCRDLLGTQDCRQQQQEEVGADLHTIDIAIHRFRMYPPISEIQKITAAAYIKDEGESRRWDRGNKPAYRFER
jgi:hypothetical protein